MRFQTWNKLNEWRDGNGKNFRVSANIIIPSNGIIRQPSSLRVCFFKRFFNELFPILNCCGRRAIWAGRNRWCCWPNWSKRKFRIRVDEGKAKRQLCPTKSNRGTVERWCSTARLGRAAALSYQNKISVGQRCRGALNFLSRRRLWRNCPDLPARRNRAALSPTR